MATQNLRVRSGNRIVVKIDGKEVGLVQSVRMSDDFGPEPASGVGDIHVIEYVPTIAHHSLNVSNMVLRTKNLRDQGIAVENGDEALLGMVMDFEIFDKDTGQLLRKYLGCSYASGDSEVSKHAILMQSGLFNALDVVGTSL